jgi:type IV secretory pathway TrbL component
LDFLSPQRAGAPGILKRFDRVTEIGINAHGERHLDGGMNMETKSTLGIVMGIVIIIADLYWTYKDYQDPTFLALGVIIFIASLVWIGLDWSLSMQAKTNVAIK